MRRDVSTATGRCVGGATGRALLSVGAALAASLVVPAALGAAPAGDGGDPQLVQGPGVAQVVTTITTLLIFILLMAVLGKFAWGPIVSGLSKREAKIRNDIAEAERQRALSEATLREYNTKLAQAEAQVREMVSKAVADGERAATEIRTRATAEAEESRARAMRDIEAARKQALTEIYERAAELSTSIAEKIIRRNLNADDQRDLVRQSLDQLQTVQR